MENHFVCERDVGEKFAMVELQKITSSSLNISTLCLKNLAEKVTWNSWWKDSSCFVNVSVFTFVSQDEKQGWECIVITCYFCLKQYVLYSLIQAILIQRNKFKILCREQAIRIHWPRKTLKCDFFFSKAGVVVQYL